MPIEVSTTVIMLISSVVVALITWKANTKTTKIEAERTPYNEVVDRTTTLERVNRALVRLVQYHEQRDRELTGMLEDLGTEPPPRNSRMSDLEKEAFGG